MKRSSGPRRTVSLSDSVQQHLNMYALAASAVGVGLALAQSAEAKIVYTPANIEIIGSPTPIDLNHDGIVDFFLIHTYTPGSWSGLQACLLPVNSFGWCISSTNDPNAFRVVEYWAAAVKGGAKIVGGDQFRSQQHAVLGQLNASSQRAVWRGPWMNGGKGFKDRYLGVKFQIKGRFHFGWARMTVATTKNSFIATLTGYAYETIPGKGIIAGQTKATDDSTIEQPDAALASPISDPPQRATLGALALGASGLSIWRREESATATPEGN
jgi:hypothetical protein